MSIGGLHPTVELPLDEAQLIDLVSAVEALSAGASRGDDLVVALFPATKRLRRKPEHFGDGADAVDATVLFCALHQRQIILHSAVLSNYCIYPAPSRRGYRSQLEPYLCKRLSFSFDSSTVLPRVRTKPGACWRAE